MRTYVHVHDCYAPIARANVELHRKYWPEAEVVLVCHREPEFEVPPNVVDVAVLPPSTGEWARDLHGYFSSVPDRIFALTLSDLVLIRRVDHAAAVECLSYVRASDVVVGHLGSAATVGSVQGEELVYEGKDVQGWSWPPGENFRCALVYSLWRRSYLVRLLEEDLSSSVWAFHASRSQKDADVDIVRFGVGPPGLRSVCALCNVYSRVHNRVVHPREGFACEALRDGMGGEEDRPEIAEEDRRLIEGCHQEVMDLWEREGWTPTTW